MDWTTYSIQIDPMKVWKNPLVLCEKKHRKVFRLGCHVCKNSRNSLSYPLITAFHCKKRKQLFVIEEKTWHGINFIVKVARKCKRKKCGGSILC